MRRLSVVLLAVFVTGGEVEAATTYWAFGDSVTRGEGGGFVLDPVAGNDCTTTPYPVAKCGYHWRLEDALVAAGVSNSVVNRGVGGETTNTGKGRIDDAGEPLNVSRCADSNAGDVLLLMEGTNDISSSISTTTIKANLGYMLNLARSKCVHGVVASTITRLLAGTPNGSRTGDPGHPATADLASKVAALAGEQNREYVDVWSTLCQSQGCYDANFWYRLAPSDPGHVDFDGYDVMALLWQAAITATPLPGSVSLSSPSGTINEATPSFSWSAHPQADWYFLEVDGGSSYGSWLAEESVCGGGTCSFDPGVTLADGGHTWRVKTRNLRGVGSWSVMKSFTVATAPPPAPSNISPLDDTFDATPTYRWNAVTGATSYDVRVDGSVPAQLDDLDPASVCSGSTCEVVQPTSLGVGPHTWQVRAMNLGGDGPFSALVTYDVLACTPAQLEVGAGDTPPYRACSRVYTAAAGFTVGSTDTVEFHSGGSIELGNLFSVLTGGTFTARTDY